ncbi:unnamed protein product, partial [marine sediment metagenome]
HYLRSRDGTRRVAKTMLKIRRLKESDRALMENFWNDLSVDTLRMWQHYESVNDIFREKSHKLIGLKNSKIVVYGFLLPDDNFPDTPSLGIVTLDSERKIGVGTLMMENLEEMGKTLEYKNIFLTTFVDNIPAFSFYKKLGYKTCEIVKRQGKDSYAMVKKVNDLSLEKKVLSKKQVFDKKRHINPSKKLNPNCVIFTSLFSLSPRNSIK